MPKSKKTRAKKYHPRIVKVGPYWPAEAQADVEAKLTQVALYVESSLPAGTLTDQQMDWIEDTLNWFLGLLYKRYELLNQQEINEVGPIAMAARKAIIIPTLKEAVALAPHKTLNEFTWAYERAKEKLKRSSNAKRESN